MATGTVSKWARLRSAALNFLHEKGIETDETFARSRALQFAHFCLLVARSFSRNRCPVRASALAYTTLLALVPLLAVGVSVTTSLLKKQGEEPVARLIDRMVNYVAPALDLQAKTGDAAAGASREHVVKQITGFIANINSGTLGVTSVLALLFVGVSLLRTIEATLNDIWGVTRARPWLNSVVYYCATIILGPFFLVAAILLTTGPHFTRTQAALNSVPGLGNAFFHALPFVILSLGFAAFYAFMPNTRVRWKAAFIGGTVGGCLWQLNNLCSVLYVSKVASYTSVYGGLGVLALFLVGLYFSWLIMLFGAQVAYAVQHRATYLQEKLADSVNQRGREFVALRIMTGIAVRFARGEPAWTVNELSAHLGVPPKLVRQILGALQQAGLVVEVNDTEPRYSPARPLENITVENLLSALRAGQGTEPPTNADALRALVRAEFDRVVAAERAAGGAVTFANVAARAGTEGVKP
jgi:membrane protein